MEEQWRIFSEPQLSHSRHRQDCLRFTFLKRTTTAFIEFWGEVRFERNMCSPIIWTDLPGFLEGQFSNESWAVRTCLTKMYVPNWFLNAELQVLTFPFLGGNFEHILPDFCSCLCLVCVGFRVRAMFLKEGPKAIEKPEWQKCLK